MAISAICEKVTPNTQILGAAPSCSQYHREESDVRREGTIGKPQRQDLYQEAVFTSVWRIMYMFDRSDILPHTKYTGHTHRNLGRNNISVIKNCPPPMRKSRLQDAALPNLVNIDLRGVANLDFSLGAELFGDILLAITISNFVLSPFPIVQHSDLSPLPS